MKKKFFTSLCLTFGMFFVIAACSKATPTQTTLSSLITPAPVTNVPELQPTNVVVFVPTKTITPLIPTLNIGSTMTGKDGMTLLYVPAGEFIMGSDDGFPDEKPAHKVNLDAFWIDQTEVTNKMYALCVQARVCKEPTDKSSYTRSSYYGNVEFDNYPMIYVNWNMAKTYCEWAGRHLLTESEWEKAARGTDANIYPWGNKEPTNNLLNYDKNIGDTTEVGKYPDGQSMYGALDLAGNVFEWVNDWYDVYPGGDSSAESNFGQIFKVLRGGSWNTDVNFFIRSSTRNRIAPDYSGSLIGFRCAMSAAP